MADYLFADAHCHLSQCSGGVRPDILHVTAGYSAESNEREARMAEQNANVYLCAGIAPQEAMKHKDIKIKLVEWEERIPQLPKLVAIGEIGLDYHWAKTEEERFLQHECFISQLVLAERLGLPVVIHSRDAEAECLDIIKSFNLPFMLHCFSGTAESAVGAGGGKAIISLPPIHSKERKKIMRDIPLERLVAESDAPYIGAEPSSASESIKAIAQLKGIGEDAASRQTLLNTALFFKID
jgi:TatD DNase family protein